MSWKAQLLKKAGFLSCLAFAVAALGCAAGKVAIVKTPLQPGAVTKSQTFLVKPFAVENAVFTGDNADDPAVVDRQKKRIPRELVTALLTRLSKSGYKGEDDESAAGTQDVVVIDGVITHVNHGSGVARFLVGFGSGAAWIKATVKLYRAGAPSDTLAEFMIESSSGGSAGAGDFTTTNVKDLANAIVDYLEKNVQ